MAGVMLIPTLTKAIPTGGDRVMVVEEASDRLYDELPTISHCQRGPRQSPRKEQPKMPPRTHRPHHRHPPHHPSPRPTPPEPTHKTWADPSGKTNETAGLSGNGPTCQAQDTPAARLASYAASGRRLTMPVSA